MSPGPFIRSSVALAGAMALGAALLVAPLHAAVVSSFDASAEGWLIIGDNSANWSGTGGNPGGCLAINDLATGQLNYASAPARFLGDWSAMGGADSLAVDIYFVNSSGGPLYTNPWLFSISGPGGSAIARAPFPAPAQGAWTTYAVTLDSTVWTMQSGTWSALLAQVQSLKVAAEYVTGDEIVELDNARLTRSPAPLFVPCVSSVFAGTALEDWSFSNTSASNPGSGGTGGGFLKLSNSAAQAGRALAPARYLGDWLPLDGSGAISFDLRVVVAGSAATGSGAFVRISGPGGSAHVPVAAGDLPLPSLLWKRFTFPIAESAWTLDSGTWTGLLAGVEELSLDANLFTGAEQIGFDNVGRLGAACAPPDETVTLHDPDVSLCSTGGLVGVGGLARDPATGVMHALARGTGSTDGVYSLNGPSAGRKLQTYDRPAGLIFTPDGDGFVSEDYSGKIFRFVDAESSMVWVDGMHPGDDDPYGMAVAPPGFSGSNISPGDVIVVDCGYSGPDQIWSFPPAAAASERLLAPDPGNVDWFDVAASQDGRVWVSDALAGASLTRLFADGTTSPLTLDATLGDPVGLAWDGREGVLYVASLAPPALYRVDQSPAGPGWSRTASRVRPTRVSRWTKTRAAYGSPMQGGTVFTRSACPGPRPRSRTAPGRRRSRFTRHPIRCARSRRSRSRCRRRRGPAWTCSTSRGGASSACATVRSRPGSMRCAGTAATRLAAPWRRGSTSRASPQAPGRFPAASWSAVSAPRKRLA